MLTWLVWIIAFVDFVGGIRNVQIKLANTDVFQVTNVTFEFVVEKNVTESALFEVYFPDEFDLITSTHELFALSGMKVAGQVCCNLI